MNRWKNGRIVSLDMSCSYQADFAAYPSGADLQAACLSLGFYQAPITLIYCFAESGMIRVAWKCPKLS